jgi:hypothetical protein
MFERFTEKARRVIFFARYEASQFGSQFIETEHMLLGILREDTAMGSRLAGNAGSRGIIREEIESRITRRVPISTSVEVPISVECKQVLNFALEEAAGLGHKHVGTEHLVLGLLRVEKGLAARVLAAHRITLADFRETLRQGEVGLPGVGVPDSVDSREKATVVLRGFLDGLSTGFRNASRVQFSPHAHSIDAFGKRWAGAKEFHAKLGELFAAFAVREAKFVIEETRYLRDDLCQASLLWENVPLSEKMQEAGCRMLLTLGRDEVSVGAWTIYSIQVTPVTED